MTPEVIVALDNLNQNEALGLADQLRNHVWGFKISDALLVYGMPFLHALKARGKVVADLKLFDIPQTMVNAVVRLMEFADIITIHASVGIKAMLEVKRAASDTKLFAITVLTSMNNDECISVYDRCREQVIEDLIRLARLSNLDGVVCTADCLDQANKFGMMSMVPGVTLPELDAVADDDQVRLAKEIPSSNYIVVDRPIVKAAYPVMAAMKIKKLIEFARQRSSSCV